MVKSKKKMSGGRPFRKNSRQPYSTSNKRKTNRRKINIRNTNRQRQKSKINNLTETFQSLNIGPKNHNKTNSLRNPTSKFLINLQRRPVQRGTFAGKTRGKPIITPLPKGTEWWAREGPTRSLEHYEKNKSLLNGFKPMERINERY